MGTMKPLLTSLRSRGSSPALFDSCSPRPSPSTSTSTSYASLVSRSSTAATALASRHGVSLGSRVALLGSPRSSFAVGMLAAWRAGGVVVPLCPSHPVGELRHVVEETRPSVVVVPTPTSAKDASEAATREAARTAGVRVVEMDELEAGRNGVGDDDDDALDLETAAAPNGDALIVMTSGSTGKPKGVRHSHASVEAMARGMIQKWEWTSADHILHSLPLHHVHGLVNKLITPLFAGASVEFMDFNAAAVWDRLAGRTAGAKRPTLFMGVPTMYTKMLDAFDPHKHANVKSDIRLFVCGSAPLPSVVFDAFERKTGHRILERYGMTETGMILTNPLRPVANRLPGFVGLPMPGLEVRVRSQEDPSTLCASGEPGMLEVRGTTVFGGYYNRAPEVTAKEFSSDGWFITGDVAVFDAKANSYKIVGRASVDIIKTAGYKVSALDIEREYLDHEAVGEIAVLGVPDDVLGEKIVAVWSPRTGFAGNVPSSAELAKWGEDRLARYKIPREFRLAEKGIPRNAMGKVQKKDLRRVVFGFSS